MTLGRPHKPRMGEAHFFPHEEFTNAKYRMLLHWIPSSLKNRSRTMWMASKPDDEKVRGFIEKCRDGFGDTFESLVREFWKVASKAGSILHFRDKTVQADLDAIREIWKQVVPRPTICALRMELTVTVFRPLSGNEASTGRWNTRRGDLVSAHELIADALIGCFYEDDSQVTKLIVEERRDCAVPSVLVEASAR